MLSFIQVYTVLNKLGLSQIEIIDALGDIADNESSDFIELTPRIISGIQQIMFNDIKFDAAMNTIKYIV